MSFFRYPGGKRKVRDIILSKLSSFCSEDICEYREPFFGGGSIGVEFLKKCSTGLFEGINKVWINDFDIGISCLWKSVIKYHKELKDRIVNFTPSTDSFYEFRDFLTNGLVKYRSCEIDKYNIVDIGFKKIAIHQISYSGLGVMSGGPLGGKYQKSDYKIDCRWSPKYLSKKIDKIHSLFSSFNIGSSCSCYDFDELLLNSSKAIVYLDPPYFYKAFNLYRFSFSNEDHIRLSNSLKKTNSNWLLSYDDCPEIRKLYSWAKIEDLNINYSISGSRCKNELLICKK